MNEKPVKEWEFDPKSILASPRKVQGIFHQPVIDKDGELISPKGMREAVPDFMHLPALHDFHKERPVGLATKVMELSGGRFYFEGVIKATSDCDDIWEKVKSGNYDQVSIFGKRTKYNNQCALPQSMRSGPCITDGVRLDSISVCDENARNPQTSLEVKKAKVIIDADTIGKQWGRDKEGNFVEITKAAAHLGKKYDPDLVHDTRAIARRLKDGTEIGMGVEEQRKKDVEAGMKMHKAEDEVEKGTRTGYSRTNTTSKTATRQDPDLYRRDKDYIDKQSLGKKRAIANRPPTDAKKAETAGESNLMHTPTDYAKEEDFAKKAKKCPCKTDEPQTLRKEDVEKGRTDRIPNAGVSEHEHAKRALSQNDAKRAAHVAVKIHRNRLNERATRGWTEDSGSQNYSDNESAMAGMRNLHKADGDDYDEDRPTTKEKGSWVKPKKDSFNPMRETGAPIPKRTKSGYPLHADKNEPRQKPSSGKPRQYAPDPSEDSKNVQRRNLGAEAVSHYEGEAAHRKGVKNALEQVESPKGGRAKVRFSLGVRKSGETMEKGKRPKVTEEPYEGDERPVRRTRKDVRQYGEIEAPEMKFKKGDEEEVEKGAAEEAQEDMYEDDDYDHVKHSDSEGKWNKNKDPNGTVKMSKAQDKGKPEEDEEEEDDEEEDEDVEKGTVRDFVHHEEGSRKGMQQTRKHPLSHSTNTRTQQKRGDTDYEIRGNQRDAGLREVSPGHGNRKESNAHSRMNVSHHNEKSMELWSRDSNINSRVKKGDEDASSELFDPSTVTKGEQMEETDHENDVEYVTKALVPIEEIDTIVKARTEEISKAYMGQLDEIKKAYDEKIGELATKIEKMENETIRKGGSVVVIPELMSSEGSSMSNADALARMQAGR